MSDTVVRIGIIGAGQVAWRHAAAYAAHPRAQLVGVVDVDESRAIALASQFGTRAYTTYDALLLHEQMDAVSICLPHALHREVAIACAKNGLHILTEKPIDTTLQAARDIITACEQQDVRLMLGFVHRFRPEVLQAKRLLADGVIGPVATAHDAFCSLGGSHPPGWVWDRAMAGGGVLMYGGVHALDRLRWLLGAEVEEVTAYTARYGGFGDVEDGLVAILRFSNGALGSIFENSPPFRTGAGWITELFGPAGSIRIKTGEWLEVSTPAGMETHPVSDSAHFDREIAEFMASILEHRPPAVTGEDGYRALAIALAIYRSAETGRPVRVADVDLTHKMSLP